MHVTFLLQSIIKLYHGGHFDCMNTKFVGYKVDYFDFCNLDRMSVFEVSEMVGEATGRKSDGMELYFKSPKEGMDQVGRLETNAEVRMMTDLINDEVQYVEVFAVLIEPLEVQGLTLNRQ